MDVPIESLPNPWSLPLPQSKGIGRKSRFPFRRGNGVPDGPLMLSADEPPHWRTNSGWGTNCHTNINKSIKSAPASHHFRNGSWIRYGGNIVRQFGQNFILLRLMYLFFMYFFCYCLHEPLSLMSVCLFFGITMESHHVTQCCLPGNLSIQCPVWYSVFSG